MTGSAITPRRTLLAFAGMFVLVGLAAVANPGLALTMAPALLLLALLTLGVRPGEALIERLQRWRAEIAPVRAKSAPRPKPVLFARPAGRVIAFGLANRPPPSGLAVLDA